MGISIPNGLSPFTGLSRSGGLSLSSGLSDDGDGGGVLSSNRNALAYNVVSSSSYVRQTRLKFTVPDDADRSGFEILYANWGRNSSSEFNGAHSLDVSASIEYGGSVYRGASVTIPAGTIGRVKIPSLRIPAGQTAYIVTRNVGASGAANRIVSHGTLAIYGEGSIGGTDTGVDYTNGVYANGATATATVTAGNITGLTRTNAGTNYTAGPNVWAYEVQPDGTTAYKIIGYAFVGGGIVTGFSITSGTPPTGVAAWVSPTIVVGNAFSNNSLGYGPTAILAKAAGSVKTLAIWGDSIAIGWSSTDSMGDANRNFGIYERGVANRCGFINLATSGAAASTDKSTVTFAKTYALLRQLDPSHVFLAIGSNDVSSGGTYSNVKADINTMLSNLRTYSGGLAGIGTILPRGDPQSITGITQAANAVVTCNNTLSGGEVIAFSAATTGANAIGGMTQIRGLTATVVSATATTITVDIDSSAFSAYTSGGVLNILGPVSAQIPETGFAAAGVADQINADIVSGAIVSDFAYVDGRAVFQDPSTNTAWRIALGYNSYDTTHPNLIGLAYAGRNSQLRAAFQFVKPLSARVLDNFSTTPAGAFGMRLLRSAYTGALLKVRRVSDDAELDIWHYNGDIPTAELTWFLTSTTGAASSFYDQSGNARHGAQATTGSQPAIDLTGTNGHPVLDFDGTDDWIDITSVGTTIITGSTPPYTLNAICKFDSTTGPREAIAIGNGSNQVYATLDVGTTNAFRAFYRDNAGTGSASAVHSSADTNWNQLLSTNSFSGSTATQTLYLNNTSVATGSGTTGTATGGNGAIGRRNINGTAGGYIDGKVAEIICMGAVISAADQSALYTSQKAYWGTP